MAEAGTLTDVHVYAAGWVGGAKFRLAVYQGGSASDPTGATLVWESGEITDTNGTAGWRAAVGTWSQTVTGSLTASRTWIFVKNSDGLTYLTNTDDGDWATGSERSSISNTTSVAYPSTVPTDPGTFGAETVKAYLTYTASAPSLIPRSMLLGVG